MPRWMKAAAAVAAAGAAAFLIERLIVTDEEAIRASLDRVRRCALAGDVEGCLLEFAPGYRHGNLTTEDLRRYGREFVQTSRLLKLEFIGRKLLVEGGKASASIDLLVRLRESGGEGPFMVRFDVLYEETEEGWKIAGFLLRQ